MFEKVLKGWEGLKHNNHASSAGKFQLTLLTIAHVLKIEKKYLQTGWFRKCKNFHAKSDLKVYKNRLTTGDWLFAQGY